MRTLKTFHISIPQDFKSKLMLWGNQFEEAIYLDSNQNQQVHQNFEALLAIEAFTAIKSDHKEAFLRLDEYQHTTQDWLFGYMSYDLKNDTEHLTSQNQDQLSFPELYFIQPKKIWILKGETIEAHYLKLVDDEIESDLQSILNFNSGEENYSDPIVFTPRWNKEQYIEKAQSILKHIQRGDIYEVNFCQEFYAENSNIDPAKTFQSLNSISKAPFSSYLKLENYYAMGASPERFLMKENQQLISQPIKGTARRGKTREEDAELKAQLEIDPKEISENVMIVDLVRNDLSKTAQKASVKVEELCKIYSYEQVHQMVSTISSRVKSEFSTAEILKSLFPMGSMTGAPKLSAMKIAEQNESTKRGLYSGAIGYITPDGNFDFNVVIRTLLYNSEKKYLSYMVGSAITSLANPEQEYEECLVKGKALQYAVNTSAVSEK